MPSSSTVFVIDDNPEMRTLYKKLLQSVNLTVKIFSSADQFLEKYNPDCPGCLILDIRMPGMSGLELQEKLIELGYQTPIIFVTGYGDVPMAVRAMANGAIDFMEKPFRPQELIDRIHEALVHDIRKRKEAAHIKTIQDRYAHLTRREQEITGLIVNGLTNKQIAAQFSVTTQAIDACRGRAMKKLKVDSIAELVRFTYSAKLPHEPLA